MQPQSFPDIIKLASQLAPDDELVGDMEKDISKLKDIEKVGSRLKGRRIVEQSNENLAAAGKTAQLELMIAGKSQLIHRVQLLFKLFENARMVL
jgi:hypothetical protein